MSVTRKEINIVRANDGTFIVSSQGDGELSGDISLVTAASFSALVDILQQRTQVAPITNSTVQ